MLSLKETTLSVCQIARRAGAYINKERARFKQENVERKHAHDYVSYVDKQSERIIVDALSALLPQAGFVTEEGTAAYHEEQYCWIVDPLDGTTNFIHGYQPFCVSIALCRGSRILVGVVYDVCATECYYAWQGGGAWCNERPLHVGQNAIGDALLCLQLPYNSDAYSPIAQRLLAHFYGRAASIRMNGSAAMSLCYVASGRLDGYAEKFLGRWDFMAGALIVAEAGGTVTDYDGQPDITQGNSIVASNGWIHSDLLEGIRAACKA